MFEKNFKKFNCFDLYMLVSYRRYIWNHSQQLVEHYHFDRVCTLPKVIVYCK